MEARAAPCHYSAAASAHCLVVIPTYNEADNVEGIVRAAAAELQQAAPGGHQILVVDDSSPDGTGEIAESSRRTRGSRCFIAREDGLGHAYLAGSKRARRRGRW